VVTQKPEILSSLETQVLGRVGGKILRATTVEFMINGAFTPGSATNWHPGSFTLTKPSS
jgi:hypothetical protein